jgi:hypothetical protein
MDRSQWIPVAQWNSSSCDVHSMPKIQIPIGNPDHSLIHSNNQAPSDDRQEESAKHR